MTGAVAALNKENLIKKLFYYFFEISYVLVPLVVYLKLGSRVICATLALGKPVPVPIFSASLKFC